MSDFLTRLAGRALGLAPLVQPVTTPRYAPERDTPFGEESEVPGRSGPRSPAPPSSSPTTRASLVRDDHHVEASRPEREPDTPATGGAPEEGDTASDSGATGSRDGRGSEQPLMGAAAEGPRPSPTDGPDPAPGRPPARPRPPSTREGHGAPPVPGIRPAATPPTPSAPESSREQVKPGEAPSAAIRHEPEVRREGSRSVTRVAYDGRGLSNGAEKRGRSMERPSDAYAANERAGAPPIRGRREQPESVSHAAGESTSVSTRTEESTIRVSIGRIDVRAVSPPASPPRRTKQPAPKMSLDDYLRARSGGTL